MTLIQPGKDFTEQRRLFQKAIGPRAVEEYDSFLQHGCSELLKQLDGFSGDPYSIIIKTIGNVLTRVAYGEHFFQHHGEEIIKNNVEGVELIAWTFTKFWLVDVIPSLRHIPSWLPGTNFKRIANKGKHHSNIIRYWSFDRVKAAMEKGITDESILSKYLREGGMSEGNLRDATASMYAAGVDTTSIAITHFLFSVTLYPEWQRRIHDEMDQTLGRGHLATQDDIPKLELFKAVFKESLRLNPAAPLGVPHVSSEEDVWNGYYIPRNSIIHCNIAHNPSVEELPDIWSIPFGFGRRICPGRYLAQRTALLYCAAILTMYEILPFEGDQLSFDGPFEDSVIRTMGNVLTRIAYGKYFFQHHGSEIIKNNVEEVELIAWASTKFWFVDVVASLRYVPAWFPGANFKRIGDRGKYYSNFIRYWSFNRVKAAMVVVSYTAVKVRRRYRDDIYEEYASQYVNNLEGHSLGTGSASPLSHNLDSQHDNVV
ncbi:hypothetical protein PIIN_05407 [Serendipita indica DSM 11827]|uniref:Cytochrome P450 n=1 Tax=Serendipita indica (strain DSM 11827) TaxID=1109443 RepID=G4TJH5_SERID|nr:hypothetical protein PIIN_05407 [Serendipita indica DSM 11827]